MDQEDVSHLKERHGVRRAEGRIQGSRVTLTAAMWFFGAMSEYILPRADSAEMGREDGYQDVCPV